MGRGRAKAKQQKVARELKYNTHFTDLDALQRELGTSSPNGSAAHDGDIPSDGDADNAEYDEYGDYADDDYGNWTGAER